MLRFITIAIPVFFLAAGVACGGRHVDRRAYVKANEEVFAALPRFPGSRLRQVTSSPRSAGEDKPTVGYVTRFELRLPERSTLATVVRFYTRGLRPRWRLAETLAGPVLNFRRRRALVSVNLENFPHGSLEIAVDHAFYA